MRPVSFDEFVGQPDTVNQLRTAVRASQLRGSPMPHVLFEGPPGCGKTSLAASVLPNELKTQVRTVVCSSVAKPEDLLPTLSTMRAGEILFLDEIHALPRQLFENLYSVMEDATLTIVVGEPPNRQPMTIALPRYTIVGATTREGLLPEPLLDRFPVKARLSLYGADDMTKILAWYFDHHADHVVINTEALRLLVPACHGTPRLAVHLVGLVCDHALVAGSQAITAKEVLSTLAAQRITAEGLNEREFKMLEYLARATRPIGLQTLSSVLDAEVETIERVIEPWLLYIGAVEKTPSGRIATSKGRALVSP